MRAIPFTFRPVTKNDAAITEYRALQACALSALREDLSESEFNSLAMDIHGFQRRWNKPYGRWCATLPAPANWRQIPAVPQGAFKRFRMACFPPSLTTRTFLTSGTTGQTRGEHHLHDTKLYDAAILAGWKRLNLPRIRSIFLSRRPCEMPDSSLAHMFGTLARNGTGPAIFAPDPADRIRKLAGGEPLALFGTALAFVHLFEQLAGRGLRLAAGSFAVETGGFKGSRRETRKCDLYALFARRLGLPADRVWNEYGMCELSSQFYTHGLGHPHRGGPWVRALVMDPETGHEAAVGETGVLRLFDLANVGSVLAIQTADLAVRRRHGFELLGRDPAAVPRGCSIPADAALHAGQTVSPPEAPLAIRFLPPALPPAPATPNTAVRAKALAKAASTFPFLGRCTTAGLLGLVASELGDKAALDRFIPHGRRFARAVAPRNILHILSANTPAAALQTILRGLLLGSNNLCKLPSEGLTEVRRFRTMLPKTLASHLHISRDLPQQWLELADAAVLFGRDETVAALRAALPPGIPVLAHGHKLSFAVVFEDPDFDSITGAARDASIFDQQGCLSPHVIFIRERSGFSASAYAARLARAMARFERHTPRSPLTVSEANTIRTLREETAFRAANGNSARLFASPGTAWTVIADDSFGFPSSPLNRVIFVKPLPGNLAKTLTAYRSHLSTCGIWPSNAANRDFAVRLGVTRICPLGRMQSPPLDWHHDGQRVLSPLVRWLDFEPA